MLSHVQEHLRMKQRGSGPPSGPEMEMECRDSDLEIIVSGVAILLANREAAYPKPTTFAGS